MFDAGNSSCLQLQNIRNFQKIALSADLKLRYLIQRMDTCASESDSHPALSNMVGCKHLMQCILITY